MKLAANLFLFLVVGVSCFFWGRLSVEDEEAVQLEERPLVKDVRSGDDEKVVVARKAVTVIPEKRQKTTGFFGRLADAAYDRTKCDVRYVPAYVKLSYPGGDVPANTGVCTDVVIRSYRALGIDLQVKVHEDMKRHFSIYPKNWGLKRPDRNIDHRRVPNLMKFFSRFGTVLPKTTKPKDYKPGDIVTWDFGRGKTHIGLVSDVRSKDGKRYRIVHNCGSGPKLDDDLFSWKIIGHYRYR